MASFFRQNHTVKVTARCIVVESNNSVSVQCSSVQKEAKSLFSSSLRSYAASSYLPKRLPVRSKTRQMAAIKGFHKTKLISSKSTLFAQPVALLSSQIIVFPLRPKSLFSLGSFAVSTYYPRDSDGFLTF